MSSYVYYCITFSMVLRIIPGVCLAQFSLSNVHKRGLKRHNFYGVTVL